MAVFDTTTGKIFIFTQSVCSILTVFSCLFMFICFCILRKSFNLQMTLICYSFLFALTRLVSASSLFNLSSCVTSYAFFRTSEVALSVISFLLAYIIVTPMLFQTSFLDRSGKLKYYICMGIVLAVSIPYLILALAFRVSGDSICEVYLPIFWLGLAIWMLSFLFVLFVCFIVFRNLSHSPNEVKGGRNHTLVIISVALVLGFLRIPAYCISIAKASGYPWEDWYTKSPGYGFMFIVSQAMESVEPFIVLMIVGTNKKLFRKFYNKCCCGTKEDSSSSRVEDSQMTDRPKKNKVKDDMTILEDESSTMDPIENFKKEAKQIEESV